MEEEILDVVDGFDNVVGTIDRADSDELLEQGNRFIRAADLFIMNNEGKLWVPVRTADKKIAPNGYDYSAGGHVESGNDYLTTILREAKEEINLDLRPEDIEFVAKLKSVDSHYIRSVYLLRANDTPVYNPQDFVAAEWLTPDELIENISEGHPAKASIRDTVGVLRTYLAGR